MKIEQVLKEADNVKGRAAELLQISYKMLLAKLKEHRTRVAQDPRVRLQARSPSPLAAAISSSIVTSVTVVVAPMPTGRTKCRWPAMTFLSRPTASTTCRAERSDTDGQRPHLRDERRQRVAVGGGHGPALDRQVGGGQHAVARRPRRAGSGGTSSPLRAHGRGCGRSSAPGAVRTRVRPLRRRRPLMPAALGNHRDEHGGVAREQLREAAR